MLSLLRAALAASLVLTSGLALASQGSLVMPTVGTVSGLTLVQDMNLALDALVTCNSGNTAPTNAASGPLKGQCWVDTSVSPNLVKVYDGTSWLTVSSIDTSAHMLRQYAGDGTLASPGISFSSETGSGFRRAGSNDIRVVIGGVDIFKFTSAGATLLTGDFNSVPVGTVVATIGSSADTGWLFGYGQCIADATYPALTTKLGSTYGTGCAGGQTRMPDFRGKKIQAADAMGGSAANIGQVSTTITTTSGSPSATVGSATGLALGMYIKSTNVPAGTTVTAISGTSITMSGNASASAGPTAARFAPVTDAEAPGATGGQLAHAQVTDELAAHSHGITDPGHSHSVPMTTRSDIGTGGNSVFWPNSSTSTGSATTGITVNSAGGGRVANVTDPSFVLNMQVKY